MSEMTEETREVPTPNQAPLEAPPLSALASIETEIPLPDPVPSSPQSTVQTPAQSQLESQLGSPLQPQPHLESPVQPQLQPEAQQDSLAQPQPEASVQEAHQVQAPTQSQAQAQIQFEASTVSASSAAATPIAEAATKSNASLNSTAESTSPVSQAEIKDSEPKEPQISDYLNYRDFLRAFYLYKRAVTKTHLRRYNYSFFSAAANIRSPNYLRLVIEGQRNLSEEMALKFAKAMQLNKEASDEFCLLVLYGQETDPSLRNQYLKNLSDFRLQKDLKQGVIDKKTLERIPNWVGWILFALLDQEGAQFNIASLKQLLRNKVSETEIQNALNKLLESGELVTEASTGEVKKGRSLIDNPEDIPVVLIRRLQTQLMCLGLESLFQDSPTEREFGTLTLSLTKKEFEELRFQLRKFRKQIHKDNAIQRGQTKGERVYQMNLQLYPVTDKSQVVAEVIMEADSGAPKESHPMN